MTIKLTRAPGHIGPQKPKSINYKGKNVQGGISPTPHKPKNPAGPSDAGGGKGPKGPKAPRGPFPTGALSYKQFLQEMHAAENLQFDPLQRQLGREENASNFRRTQEDPAWFATYKQNVADLGKQTQDAYSSALDRIQNFSQQAGAQDQAGRAATVQQLQADAERRGATVDPSVIANGQNAQAARSNLTATQYGTIAGQGANQAAYMNNRQSIGDQLGREAQQKELARMLGIQGDQRELQQKRGDFRTQYRADTRDAERKYNLGQQTIAGENSRAQLSANTSTANSKRTATTSRRGQDITAAHNTATESAAIKRIRQQQQQGDISAAQANRRIKLEKKRIQIARKNAKTAAQGNKGKKGH